MSLLLTVAACTGTEQPSVRFNGELQETIIYRGAAYHTLLRGIAIDESQLIPIGTATLQATGVVDPSVWALPGVNPAQLIVMRTPPGFDEPGWNVTDFIYFQREGVAGWIPEACPYYADPTPGCPNMDPSPVRS
jgi:hypothetical protein